MFEREDVKKMINEMNKLQVDISKRDAINGLIISIIIALIFSVKVAVVYLIGVCISILNFNISSYAINKWMTNKQSLIVIITFVRIFLVSLFTLFFINDMKLVLAYVFGFISHYINLIYCTISRKGSA